MTVADRIPNWVRCVPFRYLAGKVRTKGVVWCLRTGTSRVFRSILGLAFVCSLFIPSRLLHLLGIRFLPVRHVRAIGHLALEPDCYIKEVSLGVHPKYRTILLAPSDRVANRHLVDYWRQYLGIITSPALCSLLHPLSQLKILQIDIEQYAMNDQDTALVYEIYKEWGDRAPLLSLRESDRQRGRNLLRQMGVPQGAWFVCVHGRESGNRPQDPAHVHRNVDIHSYIPAMETIVDRGGWCVRLGDPMMTPLPPMRGVIDYAHEEVRDDWMDVFLVASCRFLLGCASGMSELASVFGVPCALANLAPMARLAGRHTDVGIPKLVWSCVEDRYLTFSEALDLPLGNFNRTSRYSDAGLKVLDNSAEDVNDLAIELLSLLEGTLSYTSEDDRLQERFNQLLKPGHYSYGARSRVGRDFLRKYAALLPGDNESGR